MNNTFTVEDIGSFRPCYYDLSRYLPAEWNGNVIDLLKMSDIPAKERLWVALREELISIKTLRLFGVWCARQVQHLMKDGRSLKALDVAEAFAHGNATDEQLVAANTDAWAAASSWTASGAVSGVDFEIDDAYRPNAASIKAAELAAHSVSATNFDIAISAISCYSVIGADGAACDAQIEQLIKMLEE